VYGISDKEINETSRKAEKKNKLEEAHHYLISKTYFETRKAIEYFMKQEKKRKK